MTACRGKCVSSPAPGRMPTFRPEAVNYSAFLNSGEDERHRLSEALDRIVAAGRIVPLTAEVLLTADRAGNEVNLKPPDATVYASVVLELDSDPGAPKCFLNRNSRDFANPDIFAELGRGNCRLIPSFGDGLAFITNYRQ